MIEFTSIIRQKESMNAAFVGKPETRERHKQKLLEALLAGNGK